MEFVEKTTAEAEGLSWKDKGRKMKEVAIRTWKIDWKLWERTTGNKVKIKYEEVSWEDAYKD